MYAQFNVKFLTLDYYKCESVFGHLICVLFYCLWSVWLYYSKWSLYLENGRISEKEVL